MSYLDFPRVHFGGLFYTDPSTINNQTVNYLPSTQLKNPDGTYNKDQVWWNPTGVSQWWLENCRVLRAVGPDGATVSTADQDAIIGASVETASPTTPQADGKNGFYGIGKMADLDPDNQMRSEVWGIRIFVKLTDGGGFSGVWQVPNLRNLYFSHGALRDGGLNNGGLGGQRAGGTWHNRLTQVHWLDGPSPILAAMKAESPNEIDVKLSVDLYQTARANEFTEGNRFAYGRVMGTMGPVKQHDPQQVVPGRRLYAPGSMPQISPAPSPAAAVDESAAEQEHHLPLRFRDVEERLEKESEAAAPAHNVAAASAAAPVVGPPWNSADVMIRQDSAGRPHLTADLGSAIPLAANQRGKFLTSGDLEFGMKSGGVFQPFANGKIQINDADWVKVTEAVERKDAYWLPNSGVVQFELTADEARAAASSPIVIRMQGVDRVEELTEGFFLHFDPPVLRMAPNITQDSQLTVYRFGVPQSTLPDHFTLQPRVLQWREPWSNQNNPQPEPTEAIRATLSTTTKIPGLFSVRVETLDPVTLVKIRQPLDSQVYVINTSPRSGDGPIAYSGSTAFYNQMLSVLFWQDHLVVDNPTWEDGVGHILEAYARLYPGMKGRLDIGDEATVKGFVQAMLAHMAIDLHEPAYMPVIRDLSPATMAMVVKWLREVERQSTSDT